MTIASGKYSALVQERVTTCPEARASLVIADAIYELIEILKTPSVTISDKPAPWGGLLDCAHGDESTLTISDWTEIKRLAFAKCTCGIGDIMIGHKEGCHKEQLVQRLAKHWRTK